MGRTLYLSETEKFKASADGPSIWIDWRNKAGQRVPVRLISRCIIIGNIDIESNLICLLATHNIPVIFTDPSGYELALVLPYNHRLPSRWREQRVFLESRKNKERYLNWVKIKRMTLQLNVLKKIFLTKSIRINREIGEGDYLIYLKALKPREEAQWQVVKDFINNLFRALIIEKLNKAGLDLNQGVIHRYHNFGLALDFGYLIEPIVDEQAILFFKERGIFSLLEKKGKIWCLTKEGLKSAIHRFEIKKKETENTIEIILDEFFNLMRELRS